MRVFCKRRSDSDLGKYMNETFYFLGWNSLQVGFGELLSDQAQWSPLADVFGKSFIQFLRILLFSADLNFNSRCRHLLYGAS